MLYGFGHRHRPRKPLSSRVAPALMPLISRGRPTDESGGFGGVYAGSNAVDAAYNTSWRVVNSPNLQPPAAPVPTQATTGGTVAAGTYTVATSYVNASGETIASSTATVTTTGTTSTITVPSPAANALATGWYAYISSAGGGAAGLTRQQTAGSPTAIGTNYVQTTPPTTGGAAPLTGTTATGNAQRIAIDISGVANANKSSVLLHWFNDASLSYWDNASAQSSGNFNTLARDYTIRAHTGAGGGAAPAIGDAGWVTLATVTGNVFRSRVHSLNLSGYNWVSIRISLSNGPVGNDDVTMQVNIHDTSLGAQDAILFLGDSITSECMSWRNPDGSAWATNALTGLVEAARSGRYPLYQNGGVPTTNIAYGDTNKATLLNSFPGRYVAVCWGANDASANTTATAYYTSLLSVIDYLIAQGKTVIVPKITARLNSGTTTPATANSFVTQYNTKIDQLATDRPAVLIGPDLYTPSLSGALPLRDGLHPTYAGAGNGYEIMQTAWRDWLLANIY